MSDLLLGGGRPVGGLTRSFGGQGCRTPRGRAGRIASGADGAVSSGIVERTVASPVYAEATECAACP